MSITINEDLYRLLKKTAGPRRMSSFISAALRDRLRQHSKSLETEYRAAERDRRRAQVLADWAVTETESWE